MSYETLFRDHLRRLTDIFVEHSAYKSRLTIGRVLFSDPKILRMLDDDQASFSVNIYDRIVSTYSRLWPEGVEWPVDIVRIDPETVRPPKKRGRASLEEQVAQ